MEITNRLEFRELVPGRERLAVVFPGQGSQVQGMGKQLIESYPPAQERLRELSDSVDTDLYALLCEETMTTDPVQVHLSMVTFGLLSWEWLTKVRKLQPAMVAGHSLGEITALACAGAIRPQDALILARQRGRQIAEASQSCPGAMTAFVGEPLAELQALVRQAQEASGDRLQVWEANYNGPQQLVVAGNRGALQTLAATMKGRGITAVPLRTAGAFHSPFMNSAVAKLAAFAGQIHFEQPRVPVISSMTGRQLIRHEGLAVHLALQLIKPVQWLAVMQLMRRAGVSGMIEAGPDTGVLCQLAQSYRDWGVRCFKISDLLEPGPEDIFKYIEKRESRT